MEIVYLKINTGEDLVASLISESETEITITNPMTISQTNMNYKIQLGMIPWVPLIELMCLNYNIPKVTISAMTQVPEDITKEYTRMVERIGQIKKTTTIPVHSEMNEDADEMEENEDEEQILEFLNNIFSNTNPTMH